MKSFDQAPGQKYSPEQRKRIKYLLEIADRNLTSPSMIGFHGTSLASLKLLIETGKLFGRPYKGVLADVGIGNKGDLYFYARVAGFPPDFDQSGLKENLEYSALTEEEAVKRASYYAEDSSERNVFMEILGLNQSNEEFQGLFNEISTGNSNTDRERVNYIYDRPEIFNEELETAAKLGLDRNRMIEILAQVQQQVASQKGLIFGLDKKLLDKYMIKNGDEGKDLFINCPDGLDYRNICGLRPLGEKEREFLANLKTQI